MDESAEIEWLEKHREPGAESCYRYERDHIKPFLQCGPWGDPYSIDMGCGMSGKR